MERVNRILSNAEFKRCLDWIEHYEKDRIFCHHGLNHLLDTARIAYILVLENNLDIPKNIIYATALLHDIGRYDEYTLGTPHNKVNDRIIKILSDCDYSTEEISIILNAIYFHRESSERLKTLGDVISKADKLTRLCFKCIARNDCYWSEFQKNNTLYV